MKSGDSPRTRFLQSRRPQRSLKAILQATSSRDGTGKTTVRRNTRAYAQSLESEPHGSDSLAISLPSDYSIVSSYSGFNTTAYELFGPSSVRAVGLGTKITPVDRLHQLPTSRTYTYLLNVTLPRFARVTRSGWIFQHVPAALTLPPRNSSSAAISSPTPSAPLLPLGVRRPESVRDPCNLDFGGLGLCWNWVQPSGRRLNSLIRASQSHVLSSLDCTLLALKILT